MAAVFAVVGAVVGEFVGAQRGLGTLILAMNAQMDTAGTFSVFIMLAIVGVVMYQAMRHDRAPLAVLVGRPYARDRKLIMHDKVTALSAVIIRASG